MRRAALLVVSILACASPPTTAPEAEPVAEPEPVAAAPTKEQALVASRSGLKGKLAQLAPIMSLVDGRAAVLWRHTTSARACEADVVLAVLKPEGGGWALESSALLFDASTPWLDEDTPPPLAATARAEDLDRDGESEILVRVRHPVMCPGGGPNTITSMFVLDATPRLAVALSTELHHVMDAYPDQGTKAIVTHDDRDVVITYTSTSEEGTTTQTNRWVYEPEADAWSLPEPAYERWGCDW